MRVGVDTGGTFTDFVWEENGELKTLKVPSTPGNPAKAILQGLERIGIKPEVLIHGTTVATNAFLERKGEDFVLITTKGFEDVILIGRQTRPKVYDFFVEKPKPFVKEENIIGVDERLSAKGEVIKPLTEREVKRVLKFVKRKGARSVAVSLLHSYKNPVHEVSLAKALSTSMELLLSLSHEVLCEIREYERTATTAINAYLSPILKRYLEALEEKLPQTRVFVEQSNGGYMPISLAKHRAVQTILSGPAGGAKAGLSLARYFGIAGVITLDMGGTSTDVCLIKSSLPFTKEYQFDGYPVSIPVIDIHTVGAGGGSIAWVDEGGLLKVGPISAGADPGPACYGKGNDFTVTDANLVLGRIIPEFFLGGEMRVFPERSFNALTKLAEKVGLSPLETALGVVEIVNTNMVRALRKVSTERGIDPSSYFLLAFGGASGLHACDLTRKLNLQGFIAPKLASSFSALGLYTASPVFDFSKTVLLPVEDFEKIKAEVESLKKTALEKVLSFGVAKELINSLKAQVFLDLRYKGQGYELCLPYQENLASAFHEAHRGEFGFCLEHFPVEVINVRVRLAGEDEPLNLKVESQKFVFSPFEKEVYTKEGPKKFKVIPWDELKKGDKLFGPLLIVDRYTTLFVEEDFLAEVKDGLTIFCYPKRS
ncbi:MAG: hydantoinase/oxoprolinase family protein [Thermodesulfobacterium sp.]|nr:hydantoinase/oxoprolinase family protein [Thermodesulfobacterium sp.]